MHLTPALAAFASYWPILALLIPLVLGLLGHTFNGLGAVLASTPWTWVRGVGHTYLLAGGLLTGLYGNWGAIAKAVTEFVSKLSSLPKGPGGAALGMLALLSLSGCAGAGPIIRNVNDVAADACLAAFGSDNPKLTPQQVIEAFCKVDEDLQPFVDGMRTAKLKSVELRAIQRGSAVEGAQRGSIAPEDGGAQ